VVPSLAAIRRQGVPSPGPTCPTHKSVAATLVLRIAKQSQRLRLSHVILHVAKQCRRRCPSSTTGFMRPSVPWPFGASSTCAWRLRFSWLSRRLSPCLTSSFSPSLVIQNGCLLKRRIEQGASVVTRQCVVALGILESCHLRDALACRLTRPSRA
jgi:hypothetical protein